ncbi:ABC transporter substrate-binding protein [Acuticoccus kandeliae]|uniref:ABC transporter substrate-binding protein n=1 Tax=Acuticoccus kandeliae TaxID=2073160 RepID=UPI000D3E3D78|nr:ABC transporter substrate-binding protein [Acuticoccus kandeliae]
MKWILPAIASLLVGASVSHAEEKTIAIANFGDHPALQLVIDGLKESMAERGFDVTYTYDQVNWERNVIPQMLAKISAAQPDVVVTITTPVTQTAVRALQDPNVPVVFAAVQDPVTAGLVPDWETAAPNMTGAANLVDMDGTLGFIKEMMPDLTRLGVPYNPGDDADNALRERLVKFAPDHGIELVLVGVDNVNDLPQRIQSLSGKVDAVYVFPSNLFQPATAQIAAITDRMGVPAFNGLPAPVEKGEMLGSYSVNWPRIGASAAGIIEQIFNGAKVSDIPPTVPTAQDHTVVISKAQLDRWNLTLPAAYADCDTCVVD